VIRGTVPALASPRGQSDTIVLGPEHSIDRTGYLNGGAGARSVGTPMGEAGERGA